MSYRNLAYWNRHFSYDRERIGDRIVVEVYRALKHYTFENQHCRAGAYISNGFSSDFYSLQRMIPNSATFEKIINSEDKVFDTYDVDFLNDINGLTKYNDIELVLKLKRHIYFEYQSKRVFNDIFGYKFKNVIGLEIKPENILSLEGSSLDNFKIKTTSFTIDIRFRNLITIT